MRFQDRLLVPKWLFDLWRFRGTRAGHIVMGGMIFSGVGTISVIVPIYTAFFGLLSLALVSYAVGRMYRPRVTVDGELPLRCSAGETVETTFRVTNIGRFPIMDLAFMFVGLPKAVRHTNQDAVHYGIKQGETIDFPLELKAETRGLHILPDLRPHTTFPFHYNRSGDVRHPMGTLLALPTFQPLDSLRMPLGTRYQPGGVALTANLGDSPEYIGNREYIPGEPARRLDFRSWARLGKPVVREYQEEYYCRIAIVLDTFSPPPRGNGLTWIDHTGRRRYGFRFGDDGMLYLGRDAVMDGEPLLEAGVSLSAAIGDALSRGEYLIDLFAAGPELHIFRSGTHTRHLENLLELLACVGPSKTNPFDKIAPAITEELGRISTTVCIFLDWDASRQALARSILESGCSLKVIVIRPDHATDPLNPGDVEDFTECTVTEVLEGRISSL